MKKISNNLAVSWDGVGKGFKEINKGENIWKTVLMINTIHISFGGPVQACVLLLALSRPTSVQHKVFSFLFLETEGKGGRKRGRGTMCGCLSHAPYWGLGPQPRHVPSLGIEPVTLWFASWHSTHWATPATATECFLARWFPSRNHLLPGQKINKTIDSPLETSGSNFRKVCLSLLNFTIHKNSLQFCMSFYFFSVTLQFYCNLHTI